MGTKYLLKSTIQSSPKKSSTMVKNSSTKMMHTVKSSMTLMVMKITVALSTTRNRCLSSMETKLLVSNRH